MEWRARSTVGEEVAFTEARRWVEEVTKKTFGNQNFRSALENGVLLCDLINRIKPGIIRRVNRLSTPIAGLDNVNVFLKACGKLGLKEAQLFHPGDLQDLSTRVTVNREETTRRLKNVLITIYWLGRKAQADPFYNGPYLNLRAFEGLLGIALSKALEDSSGQRSSVRDCSFGNGWCAEREGLFTLQSGHKREDSLDSLDSVDSRTLSTTSDTTVKGIAEGSGSDAETDFGFRMSSSKDSLQYRRSLVIEPRPVTQFNQFLPSKDKQVGYVPAPLRKKRAERHEDSRRSWASPMYTEEDDTFASEDRTGSPQNGCGSMATSLMSPPQWACEYESGSDSDVERPEPDVVLDDLANRRFRSPSPIPPVNYAVPMGPRLPKAFFSTAPEAPRKTLAYVSGALPSSAPNRTHASAEDIPAAELCWDSDEEEEDEEGFADPIQDDLYTRKVGLPLQPSTNASYDKFLPKYWTPEEEAHVRNIRLGSQRRPWYKKMQGFSRSKSGSSSEDSDCDVSPWLAAAGPARPRPDVPLYNPYAPGGPAPSHHRCTAQSAHTQQHTVAQPHAGLLQSGPPKPQPSFGPRVIRCTSSIHSPEHDSASGVIPDLENDDMFARRTRFFLTSMDSASLMSKPRLDATPPMWSQTTIVTQPRRGDSITPDIEHDDMVFRKFNRHKTDRPPSGAPDTYHPVPVPEPRDLPSRLRSNLLCMPCPPTAEDEAAGRDEHPSTNADDMHVRRLAVGRPNLAKRKSPTVPPGCSNTDLDKWQAIREASRLRYKRRLMVERLLQGHHSNNGSKSVNDIPEESAILRQAHYEELQKIRAQVKESEDKWQDDLTKWKNRRRSLNSSIVKKEEHREQMEKIDGRTGAPETFRKVQEKRENGERAAPSGESGALVSMDANLAPQLNPTAKTLLGQSVRAGAPRTVAECATGLSVTPTQGEKFHGLQTDTPVDPLFASPTTIGNLVSECPPSGDYPKGMALTDRAVRTDESSSASSDGVPEFGQERDLGPLYTGLSVDTKAEKARVSVSLPRSYQRSDSSRLTSMVTPRPFGSQSSRVSSLPRTFAMDSSQRNFSGNAGIGHATSVPSRYSQFVTSEDEAQSQSSSAQSGNEDEEDGEPQQERGTLSSAVQIGDVPQPRLAPVLNSTPDGKIVQECYSDMRISLNQKAGGSHDFGFQTSWDSTGARVKTIQRGSPAELCQLQVGDEILALGGQRVSEMSYEEWKSRMDSALQQGTLVMDVRRHGKNSGPEKHLGYSGEFSSRPSLETAPKSELSSQPADDLVSKGVNGGFSDYTVTRRNKEYEPISLRNLKRRSEFFEQQGGSESAISDLPVPSISAPSNRWSWDPEEERRRQERWQKEQERLLQEKYKRDQEKLDEEWRRAQLEAMKEDDTYSEVQKNLEVENKNTVTLHSSILPPSKPVPPTVEDEREIMESRERSRQEEEEEEEQQETMWLREQEERRERKKREAERRGLEEEEQQKWEKEEERRKSQLAAEDQHSESERVQEQQPRSGSSCAFSRGFPEICESDRTKSKSTSDLDDVDKPVGKEVYGTPRSVASRPQKNTRAQRSRSAAQLAAHRRSILIRCAEPQRASSIVSEASWSRDAQRKRIPQLSQAELERQQILQEMKKKTQLLTDNSWIRQRNTSIHKEPVSLPGPIRRGESLNNLDSARPWRPTSWTAGPGFSASGYSRPHSAFSGSSSGYSRSGSSTLPTSFSTGSLRQGLCSQPPTSSPTQAAGNSDEQMAENQPPTQQRTSVSAASLTSEAQNVEPRSESETDSCTATPATSGSKLGSPQPCDLTLQQIEEETS